MTISDTERKILIGCINSLRGREGTSKEVVGALQGPARLFLETYVIAPLIAVASPGDEIPYGLNRKEAMKSALYMSLYKEGEII